MPAPIRSHLRLCVSEGITIVPQTSDGQEPTHSSTRRRNIYTSYIEKSGSLPSPETADTIGRLLGTRVKANDGKEYPTPTRQDKRLETELRRRKKLYHAKAKQVANLEHALSCLASAGDPTSLAIHMKNRPHVGLALDLAIEWISRFAEEWQSCAQSCSR